MADNSRNKQKKSPLGGLVVILIFIVINVLNEASPSARAALIPLLLGVGVIALVLAAAAKAVKKAAGSSGGASPARSGGFRNAGDSRAHTSRESFPSPDAYCLVCDQTNVDHFERDRQRRLRQLDYWLSIGLIDRKEYRTLQAKYSKSVPHSGV